MAEIKWLESQQRWQACPQRNGVRKTFTSAVPGSRGAKIIERKIKAWEKAGSPTPVRKADMIREVKTIESVCDKMLNELEITRKGYADSYRSICNTWVLPALDGKIAAEICEQDFQDVILAAYTAGRAKTYLIAIRDCILVFLRYLRKSGLTTLMPEKLYVPADAPEYEKGSLQPEHIKTLFSSDKTTYRKRIVPEWYIHAFRLAVLIGVRPGELKGIQTERDIDGRVLTIREAINSKNKTTNGKNKRAQRHFILNKYAVSVVADQIAMLNTAGVESKYLFPEKDGGFTRAHVLARRWENYREYNGLPDLTPYELSRHTFISVCKNLDDPKLKRLIGHGDKMPTRDRYGHDIDGELEEAASEVEEIFSEILEEKE